MSDEPTVQPTEQGSGGASEGGAPAAQPEQTDTVVTTPTDDRAKFLNMIPKEYRDHPSLKDYKDFGSFVKSHINLVGLLGREPRVPAKDAPPDQWNQFYSALGRPDTHDQYKLPIPTGEGAPEVIPEVLDGFKKAAHEAGLTQSQAFKLTEWFFDFLAKQSDELAAQTAALTEKAERELQRELGQAYEAKITAAARMFMEIGGQELIDWMELSGAGSNPHLIRFGIKIADMLSEDRLGHSRPRSVSLTPEEAQREISRLNLDAEFQKALWDRYHPGHEEAVRRRNELYAAAFPTVEETS